MRRWAVIAAFGALALGAITPSLAQAPPSGAITGPADVLVLVYQQAGAGDLVGITYLHAVPHAQAQRDLAALARASGWKVGPGHVSDATAPVAQKIMMTSTKVTIPGVIRPETHLLPVEPFLTAFRPYKRLALIFSVSPDFQFQGPRDYADNNVQIALTQGGTAYTYQARILNPQFTRLDLPTAQAAVATTAPQRPSPGVLLLGILMAAGAAGLLVYVLMARKMPPPPPGANTDALAEERTKIGT